MNERMSTSNALPPTIPPTANVSAPRRTAATVVTSSGSDVVTAVNSAPTIVADSAVVAAP